MLWYQGHIETQVSNSSGTYPTALTTANEQETKPPCSLEQASTSEIHVGGRSPLEEAEPTAKTEDQHAEGVEGELLQPFSQSS